MGRYTFVLLFSTVAATFTAVAGLALCYGKLTVAGAFLGVAGLADALSFASALFPEQQKGPVKTDP